jgi:hypothetical protein
MPDRRKSTRKPRQPKPKQPQLLPPPRRYDEGDGWRRTLLYRVTNPQERDALIQFSKMLDRLLLEEGSFWHELCGPSPEVELWAAATDLVHVAEFLRRLNVEHGFDPYDDEDRPKLRLCRLAERLSLQVLKVADAIGAALPPEEAGAA